MNLLAPSRGRPRRTPSLSLLSADRWARLQRLTYRFARQARHDTANLHSGLQLMKTMREMIDAGDDLSDDGVDLAWIESETERIVSEVAAVVDDLVLLNQAANPVAYEPARPRRMDQLLERALIPRDADGAPWARDAMNALADVWVLELGDMLQPVLVASTWQWSYGMAHAGRIEPLRWDASDGEMTLRFDARQMAPLCLNSTTPCQDFGGPCSDQGGVIRPTLDLAMCVARDIAEIHAGELAFDEGTITLSLPRIRAVADAA